MIAHDSEISVRCAFSCDWIECIAFVMSKEALLGNTDETDVTPESNKTDCADDSIHE